MGLREAELLMQHMRTFLAHGQVEVPPTDIPVEGMDKLLEVVRGAEGVGWHDRSAGDQSPSPSISDEAYTLQLCQECDS